MKTENELNEDILNITMTIKNRYPELSKYIAEMPVRISYNKENKMSLSDLYDYYDSLKSFLITYELEQTIK